MATASEIQDAMKAVFALPRPDVMLVDKRAVLAIVAVNAFAKAGMEYDMAHGFWTPPFWDRRARKKTMNKAAKAARRQWLASEKHS